MSLLMQALKKAEQAKQTGVSAGGPSAEAEQPKPVSLSDISLLPLDEIAAAGDERREPEPAVPAALPEPIPETDAPTAQAQIELMPIAEPDSAGPAVEVGNPGLAPQETVSVTQPVSAPAAPEAVVAAAPPVSGNTEMKAATAPKAEPMRATATEKRDATAAQHRAKAVFSAKQNTGTRRTVAIAGGAAVIAAVGIGAWYLNAAGLFGHPPLVPANVAVAPAAPEAATQAAAVQAEAAPASPMPPAGNAPAEIKQKTADTAPPPAAVATSATSAATTAVAARTTQTTDAKPSNQAPAAEYSIEQPGIQIRQTTDTAQVNASVSQAYQAYMAGDFGTAEQKYRRALQQEPNNRDALLGLAAVALKRQQKDQAASWFLKLLEADPSDPDATAGLLSMQHGDFAQNESRLKKVLAQHPGSGPVQFALGNLYAQQARWGEAQQAYFQAFTSTPGNADYAFNLAVSLDRLNQPRLALEYYQRALKLASSGHGNFSSESANARVQELQKAANE